MFFDGRRERDPRRDTPNQTETKAEAAGQLITAQFICATSPTRPVYCDRRVALAQRRREGEAEGAEKGRMLKLRRWSATGESNRTTISANKKRKLV